MNGPAHSGWLNHGLAVALVFAGLWVLYERTEQVEVGSTSPDPGRMDYPLHGYLDNYKGTPYLAAVLAKSLSDGSSIVLLGSSELTTADHPSKPVNFFNDELHVPLFALGHAGNQSFSMHAQLIAAGGDLTHARLAILVSPSWFVDKSGRRGTELAAFLEYQPSPSLYRIQQRVDEGDPWAVPVGTYMAEHAQELGSAQPIVQWITRNASSTGRYLYTFSQPWNAAIIRYTRPQMLGAPSLRPWSPEPRGAFPPEQWRSLFEKGVAEHLARCTNNRFFVNDGYYAEYVNGRTRILDIWPVEENRELNDFIGLLDFLEAAHAKPYFILQPLNPYVYTNTEELEPTIERIRQELNARDFSYLDLWVHDTADFRPGTLTDIMHLGPLGWYRIDSAMAGYFP